MQISNSVFWGKNEKSINLLSAEFAYSGKKANLAQDVIFSFNKHLKIHTSVIYEAMQVFAQDTFIYLFIYFLWGRVVGGD